MQPFVSGIEALRWCSSNAQGDICVLFLSSNSNYVYIARYYQRDRVLGEALRLKSSKLFRVAS